MCLILPIFCFCVYLTLVPVLWYMHEQYALCTYICRCRLCRHTILIFVQIYADYFCLVLICNLCVLHRDGDDIFIRCYLVGILLLLLLLSNGKGQWQLTINILLLHLFCVWMMFCTRNWKNENNNNKKKKNRTARERKR